MCHIESLYFTDLICEKQLEMIMSMRVLFVDHQLKCSSTGTHISQSICSINVTEMKT